MPESRNEPPFDCHCNWCGRDFTDMQMITNTCKDCRRVAHHAYMAALQAIRDGRTDA